MGIMALFTVLLEFDGGTAGFNSYAERRELLQPDIQSLSRGVSGLLR
jgi:hypothetical protein